MTRKLYTLAQLTKLKVLAITVRSTVINPDEWLYTKYPDGMFWPYIKIEEYFIQRIFHSNSLKKQIS